MKNIHIYFLSLMLLGFSSCTKFLDRQNPMTLNPDQAYNTVEKCGAGIGGLMANFTSSSFTGRNIPVFGDLFTDNATTVYAPSGHLYDIENWNVSTSQGDMASIWAGCYATAAQATDLIIAINKLANSEKDGLDAKISEDNIKQLQVYRGAALSIKAYCEWLLIQYYCLPYYNPEGTDNGNTNGIILIGDSKIGITEKVHTSSLKASYDHIVAEIDTAISLYTRNNKQTVSYSGIASWEFVPSLAMAYILKGRIMLDLKRNNEAIEAADLAIVNATNKRIVSDTTELLEMYQKEATPTPEDIWTIYFDKSDNNSANSINNFFRDYRTTLSNDLVNLFNGNLSKDIRKVLYKGPAAALAKTDSVKSFCLKYPNVSDVNNVPLMRLPEAYYIKAEAQTKLGNISGAKETMFEIISKRNSNVTDIPSMETIYGTGNSKEDVLNFIITDKRREFAGEGLRWFDLRRNSMRLTRTGYSSASAPSSDDPNSPTTVTLSYRKVFINYPIYKICLPIPDIETNTRQWTGNQNEVWATENGSPTFELPVDTRDYTSY